MHKIVAIAFLLVPAFTTYAMEDNDHAYTFNRHLLELIEMRSEFKKDTATHKKTYLQLLLTKSLCFSDLLRKDDIDNQLKIKVLKCYIINQYNIASLLCHHENNAPDALRIIKIAEQLCLFYYDFIPEKLMRLKIHTLQKCINGSTSLKTTYATEQKKAPSKMSIKYMLNNN